MDCLFCRIGKKEIESKVIYEDEEFLAFLDVNQEIMGHTLIIPKKHIEDYTELDSNTLTKMFEIAKKISPILMEKLEKKGITLLFNYGESQEIKHVHLHLLPDFGGEKSNKTQQEIYEILKDD